jgi:hypothetical protein
VTKTTSPSCPLRMRCAKCGEYNPSHETQELCFWCRTKCRVCFGEGPLNGHRRCGDCARALRGELTARRRARRSW